MSIRIDWTKADELDHTYVDILIDRGVLVPVEPCEHGNYAEHIVSVHVWAGVPTWCPGVGIGGNE